MVFWSSFSKKIKQAVSQISFDALKKRVDTIETTYATKTYTDTQNQAQDTKINANTTNITTNTNSITTLDTKVDGVINGLQNGNIINYTGPFDNAKTYSIAQATTYTDKWYVSNQNNNVGHTPSGSSDAYWELLSEPTINLQPYLTKTEASNTYLTKTDASNNYLVKTMLNTMFPVGSNVMTTNGQVHALVNMYPTKFRELTDTDIAYLAIGTNSSNSNSGTFTIQQSNLPNINWSWYVDWNTGITSGETNLQAYANGGSARMDISGTYTEYNHKNASAANNSGARAQLFTRIYLNGNTTQDAITYLVKPKTLKIRMWEVIANLV